MIKSLPTLGRHKGHIFSRPKRAWNLGTEIRALVQRQRDCYVMIIERIQVEEGFLDGLDLCFTSGLNVVIGPRGSGKTSLIELIRFCLGAPALTDRATQNSREHALSILGSGRVTVTLNDGNGSFTVSRTSESWTKSHTAEIAPPLILSQNEIESVGLHASGRLRLIDNLRPTNGGKKNKTDEDLLLSYIRSQSEERRSICTELVSVRNQLRELAEQIKEAEALKKQHTDALHSMQQARSETERLNQLGVLLAALSVRTGVYNRALVSLKQRQSGLQPFSSRELELEAWPNAASCDDPLAEIREKIRLSHEDVREALVKIADAIARVRSLSELNSQQALQYEEEARKIRRQLDSLEQGAGEIARRLAHLQEKAGQQSALQQLEKNKLAALERVQSQRKNYLDRLEAIRTLRFEDRAKLILQLNADLAPQIKISIERGGLNSEYASAIVAALRGSGLRFNEVAPVIADEMSPREFVEAVENEDIATLAEITGIALTRAAKIVERINDQGVEAILTASVEDGVTLALLDGADYKTTEQLSTGQRCTVVLPLLLKQHRLSLVVDQPEDHLDNGFIVDTLIKAILQRKREGQLIFSTHNANIPVLGDADQVVLLGSDGSRGFARHMGPLDHPRSVQAITTVMEGGLEAFDRRSKFYHGNH